MDNITILLLSVVSQWVVKTASLSSKEYSHLVLIAVKRVCDNISVMSIVMFSDGRKSVTIVYRFQEVIICVSYFG